MADRRPFLLLDPPTAVSFRRRGTREKDGAPYAPFPSIDLILLSGVVRDAGYQPVYIDAQLDNLTWGQLIDNLRGRRLAGVVSLISSSQIDEELAQLGQLKEALGNVPLYVVGTLTIQRDRLRIEKLMREVSWLDGVILNTVEHNFGEIIGVAKPASVEPLNIAVRGPGGPVVPETRVRFGSGLHIPQPEHAIFKDRRYCFPQSKRTPVTCVQLSFGCPFNCAFCLDNQLYRKMLYRDVDDVVAELVGIERLGFREVYFKDLTFGVNKRICTEFLEKLAGLRLRLRWLCSTRVDVVTTPLLRLMKQAGCYGIEFGVESGMGNRRAANGKSVGDGLIRRVFSACRSLGIETTAFVMMGFVDETAEETRATMRFIESLRPDYVSYNIVNALPGTALERRARKEGFLRCEPGDYGYATSNIKHRYLTPARLARLHREATRSFYCRPSVILGRLTKLKSVFELRKMVRLGWENVLRPRPCT